MPRTRTGYYATADLGNGAQPRGSQCGSSGALVQQAGPLASLFCARKAAQGRAARTRGCAPRRGAREPRALSCQHSALDRSESAADETVDTLCFAPFWALTRGYGLTPWRSRRYLRWRIEAMPASTPSGYAFLDFWRFAWRERHDLIRYLRWTDRMRQRQVLSIEPCSSWRLKRRSTMAGNIQIGEPGPGPCLKNGWRAGPYTPRRGRDVLFRPLRQLLYF